MLTFFNLQRCECKTALGDVKNQFVIMFLFDFLTITATFVTNMSKAINILKLAIMPQKSQLVSTQQRWTMTYSLTLQNDIKVAAVVLKWRGKDKGFDERKLRNHTHFEIKEVLFYK